MHIKEIEAAKITTRLDPAQPLPPDYSGLEEPNPVQNSALNTISPEHAIIVKTLDSTITDINRAAENLFGYQRHEMVGQSDAVIIPLDRAEEYQECLKFIRQGQMVAIAETMRLHRSGKSIQVSLTESPLRDANGSTVGSILAMQDLAEIKQLEQQFRQAQKMEAFGQLAAGVAHDFNNLLTVIQGYSEVLMGQFEAGNPVHGLISEIHKAGLHAESLTRQLLAFTRQQALEPKVLDLNAVISDTEKMLRRLIGENILLTAMFAPNLRPVKVDEGQIQQVILNLAVNARDAMPGGGSLMIETANVILSEGYAQSHLFVRTGNYVMLAMTDTGIGMTADVKARIFEPFFTTKGPGKGTGLGLATVYGIVKQYGGHIDVESEPGQGSIFKVYLPQVQDPVSIFPVRSTENPMPGGTEIVLFVEDEEAVRTLACYVLDMCGYTTLAATNGEEALRLVETHAETIDLLVTDVVMPYVGGHELAERLLARYPQLKVLFLSGHLSDEALPQKPLPTVFTSLSKPFTPTELAKKVREVLEQ